MMNGLPAACPPIVWGEERRDTPLLPLLEGCEFVALAFEQAMQDFLLMSQNTCCKFSVAKLEGIL